MDGSWILDVSGAVIGGVLTIVIHIGVTFLWNQRQERENKKKLEQEIFKFINSGSKRFWLHYDPERELKKIITFQEDKRIGVNQNQYESTWDIINGHLEIYNDKGAMFSRFALKNDGALHHTNESECLGKLGQFITRSFERAR